jgi:hypothetical protein
VAARDDDWRLTGQARFLQGAVLHLAKYRTRSEVWNHDHCEFCWKKFTEDQPDTLQTGYTTEDHYRWICEQCFNDFRERFEFRSASETPPPS